MNEIIYRVIRTEGFVGADGHGGGSGTVVFVSTNREETKVALQKLKGLDCAVRSAAGTKTLTHVMDEINPWEANIRLEYAY